ncbi:hypothetical protein BayCH28_15780 [Mycolicibacterium sp. CH28]|uniref:anti-sigma-D factor RsdA n=1 Tax=Mycolicibacterium sp. CH28 TaxID=2512237 RepID=UPI0010815426|nr:anti-sigma-D factor RsdA [Mycolicibacterium sp. CH28]TGD86711.1 hypothetical protein BayCH28_15780 [Mycolicibacterium sp. CH28]
MPDFGRNSRNDDPSLDAVIRSDRFVDALATGRQAAPQDQTDALLAAMLGDWRDEMRWPPATGLITERDAISALRTGLSERHSSGRSRRGLSIVGAVAAGVLAIGGFGAVVAGAGPGDALYGLRTMLFGAPKQVRDDQVTLAAKTEMAQVQQLISQGDWQQAQDRLVAVSTQVASVGNEQQKQELLDQWNQLSAKVVQKDPEATVPPGITYTVPPSATELVPAAVTPTDGPGVPPTSVPDLPSITLSTLPGEPSGTGTFAPTTSESPTSPVEQTQSPTSATAPTTEPTTTAPATTSVSTTTAPATTSVPTTTTSMAPSTTTTTGTTPTTTTTTVAPTTTTTTTTPLGAAAQAPAAGSSTTQVLQQSAASTPPAASSASAPPAAATQSTQPQTVLSFPSTVVQAPKAQPPIVITTTMVMPMPLLPQLGGGHSGGN